MHTAHTHSFAELLQSAVSEPGTLSQANRQFHSYSLSCRTSGPDFERIARDIDDISLTYS